MVSSHSFAVPALTAVLPRRNALLRPLLVLLAVIVSLVCLPPRSVSAAPLLSLPTPAGERWKIIQGYGCGTHNSWDVFSLDLVNMDGPTIGAPIRAAADGTVFVWQASSGTLILRHGDNFYTQYTHLSRATDTRVGREFMRGEVVGRGGERGTVGNAHLHFMAFTASGAWARNRQTVPLSFAEGYDFPQLKGCNQHGGKVVVAGGERAASPTATPTPTEPTIAIHGNVEAGVWYNSDTRLQLEGAGLAGGYSIGWDAEPASNAPAYGGTTSTELALNAVPDGLRTLFVRGWDAQGVQRVATLGPIGIDNTAPTAPAPFGDLTLTAGAPVVWQGAADAASGVAGYRVYIGPDPLGMSDWYVTGSSLTTEELGAGTYQVRVQPVDFAGNTGTWATLGTVTIR